MIRVVADLGNSRLKLGRLGPDGRLADVVAVPLDGPEPWAEAVGAWGLDRAELSWRISSVNPPALRRLLDWLGPAAHVHAITSAAEVDIPHRLTEPARTGADRALAVRAFLGLRPDGVAGQVVLCGTAITVERVSADGVWSGGAIAPGLRMAARALREQTAQLPEIGIACRPPAAWGTAPEPALAAGVFWGAVGSVRELLQRQAEELGPEVLRIWSGGDAELLAPEIEPTPYIDHDLVLEGLAATWTEGR